MEKSCISLRLRSCNLQMFDILYSLDKLVKTGNRPIFPTSRYSELSHADQQGVRQIFVSSREFYV